MGTVSEHDRSRDRGVPGAGHYLRAVSDERKIPKGRVRRSAKLGSAMGMQATRYAGTKAAEIARTEEGAKERLEARHIETALKMAPILGEMKGAAMKLGQLASFIDTEFLPPEYAEIYQEELAKLRTSAPAMPWDKVRKVLEEEYRDETIDECFGSFEEEAFAAASIGQVHRATLIDGRQVAVKIQYPGVAEALEADLANAGMLVRLARALAPGLDAKAVAEELRERVLEELDYEYEAQNQRTFARGYRGHPFIYVPEVITRLSRRRVLVSEYVEGKGFEEIKGLPESERSRFGEMVFRFCFGSIYHLQTFNADSHPGNFLLMDDGRIACLDFDDEEARRRADPARAAGGGRCGAEGPGVAAPGAARPRLRQEPVEARRRAADGPRDGGRRVVPGGPRVRGLGATGDEDHRVDVDPRSEYYDLMRRENVPAEELMGRRMETGLVAVLAQLGARRNWHRIMREWVYADPPETELGELEWEYFESRGQRRVPGYASRHV